MLDLTIDELTALGENRRIQTIKMIRERTRLGLKEAIDLLDSEGFKAGLLEVGTNHGVGTFPMRPVRLNPDIPPNPDFIVPPPPPEAKYLREWMLYYIAKSQGANIPPPAGIDPMLANEAVASLRSINRILFNNSIKDKVVRIKHIVLALRKGKVI